MTGAQAFINVRIELLLAGNGLFVSLSSLLTVSHILLLASTLILNRTSSLIEVD